jgi:transposase
MQLIVSGLLNQFQRIMQGFLFPRLQEELGPLSLKHQHLIAVLGLVQLETILAPWSNGVGRPSIHRRAIARAFVAKAIFNLNSTRQLLDRLAVDNSLRRLCGWESVREIPHESQFSRAFAEFANSELPQRLHEALIKTTQQERLIGHISRDSTEIEAREKPVRVPVEAAPIKEIRKRGRPKKGDEPPPPEPARLERQAGMTLKEMIDELPKDCNVGSKKNSKGYKETWVGYKLHIDAADGQIPISCILTSASLHDSQAAIPLALMTAQRVTNLYNLMDSAYDAQSIHEYIRGLGQIPIIDVHPRRDQAQKAELQAEAQRQKLLNFNYAEDVRYRERTTVERVNARLKDEFGGRWVRVRGNAKVMCHLMFGILALAADQILRLIT